MRPVAQWTMAHRAPAVAGLVAAAAAVAYLLAPPAGRDLAAQLAHAHFARAHPLTPVDLSWFGGSLPFGYSLWTPAAMGWTSATVLGALGCVAATVLTVLVFERTGAVRPLVGGVLLAATQAVNMVEGRVTFTLGMVFGLAALLALTASGRRALVGAGALTFVAAAASPVVALYLWLCAGALVLRRRWAPAVALVAGTVVPVAITTLVFGDGGYETFDGRDARDALLATLAVAIFVPLRHRTVKIGAMLGIVLVAAAYVLHTPVGNNATRLSMIFAVPMVAAYVSWRPWLAALAVLLTAWPQQVTARYVFRSGPAATAAYYAPLLARIGPAPAGRVEVPETQAHWDDYYLARAVPLARGWIRQVDLELNGDVFFAGPPSARQYRQWLQDNAVQYVAVPDTDLTHAGHHEVQEIERRPSYLRRVWSNEHWTLYAVRGFAPVVAAPGHLVRSDQASLTLTAPAGRVVDVRVRWWRWLTLSTPDGQACIEPGTTTMIRLHTGSGGSYRITSTLGATHGHC